MGPCCLVPDSWRWTHAETKSPRNLAARLRARRLFPRGRAIVPFVKAELFEHLLAVTAPDALMPARAASKPAEAQPKAEGGQCGGSGGAGAGAPPLDQRISARAGHLTGLRR